VVNGIDDVDSLLRSLITASTTAVCREWQSDDVLRRRRKVSDEQSLSLQEEVLRVARQQAVKLKLGIELTAVEFTAIQPPGDVREAFVAIQDARVDQESWREEANGEAAEIRLNAERMALVAIADAKGKLDSVLGKVAAELELFEADLAAFEGGSSDITARRLQREVWESILKDSGRVIAVPAGQRAEGLWLSLPDQEKSR
jgi:membrane protease subunit HflK